MADETDNDEQKADGESDGVQAGADSGTDSAVEPDAATEKDNANSTAEGSEGNESKDSDSGGAGEEAPVVVSNVIPIDVFEPLGRYQSYLKVLSTCVTELADEAAASVASYLRRPVTLRMGDIRVIGQANCQPENSLLNGSRDFFKAAQVDGYFYVGLSDKLVAYLVELFYGGAVDTLSIEAASPGCVSEMRMRRTVGEFFNQALSVQLHTDEKAAPEDLNGQLPLTAIGEQELIKQQFSKSMLSVTMTLESDGLKCELETGFCINLLEKLLGVSFSSSEPVAISDARWSNELRKSVDDCDLELRCTMAELPVRLGDVQKFKVGDFIPLADLDSVIFSINRRKLFQGQFGVVDEKPSASFKRWV